MACEQTDKLVTAYLGGELDPQATSLFEQHLVTCGSCTAEVAGNAVLDRSLKSLRTRFQPTASFTAKVFPPAASKPSLHRRFTVSSPWLVFATAALILVFTVGLWVRTAQSRQIIAEISDIHAATLASSNPVDIVSTNRHVVKPWFEGKVPFAFDVPELDKTGFSLDGGRLIYLRQQPGAELLLHYGLHRCSLVIFQDTPYFSNALSQAHSGAFHLEMIRSNGLIFFVIGDIDRQALRQLGNYFATAQSPANAALDMR